MELLTVKELQAMLKISKSQIYELATQQTRTGEPRKDPLPCLRIGSSVRFLKSDVEKWLLERKVA